VVYLVSLYPFISHTFIQREIDALSERRRHGGDGFGAADLS